LQISIAQLLFFEAAFCIASDLGLFFDGKSGLPLESFALRDYHDFSMVASCVCLMLCKRLSLPGQFRRLLLCFDGLPLQSSSPRVRGLQL
jgi:hypothetical protein